MRSGVELVELVDLFADADEFDRHAGEVLDAERRAAAGVAVEFGEDAGVEFEGVVERLGDVGRLLADHRVDDEVDLVRLAELVDLLQLIHQIVVDLQSPGGVEDDRVAELFLRLDHRIAADVDRVGRLAVDRHADLGAERLQLLDGTGALQVGCGEERLAAPRFEGEGELRGSRRFARPLQPAQHDDDRPVGAQGDFVIDRTHEPAEFFVDDFDDLLGRIDPFQHVLPDGLGFDVGDELRDDREVDVGFEQGPPDFAQPFADVVRREPPPPA